MITNFNELRGLASKPYEGSFSAMSTEHRYQYVQSMALIQIAQELNEIKVFLSLIGPQIEKIANPVELIELRTDPPVEE